MQLRSDRRWSTTLLILATLLLIAKAIAVALLWWLPKSGIDETVKVSVHPPYGNYKTASAMGLQTASTSIAMLQQRGSDITNLVLKGIYGTRDKGFAIVARRSRPDDTVIIGIDESVDGYTLQGISSEGAHFIRGGSSYTLRLERETIPGNKVPNKAGNTPAVYPVQRAELDRYRSDITKIAEEIRVADERVEGELKGFRVTFVKPGSRIAQLGLQQGDVLIEANGKRLDSYATAIGIYKKAETLRSLELVVERNERRRELRYELQ
jgi:type II secretion system protein C